MELEIIKGAEKIITKNKPVLYVENDRIEKSEDLVRHLMDIGYRLWWDLPHYFNKDNYFGIEQNIYGTAASFNMVCLHKDVGADVPGSKEITDPTAHPIKNLRQGK